MSRRRKNTRGNPAAHDADLAAETGASPQRGLSSLPRGLRGFREAEAKGESPAQRPQRRASDMKDGFLTEANQRAAEGEYSSPKILVYALLAMAGFLFFYLHLYAMPQLRHFADGESMPGARWSGYSATDIEHLRAVMEDTAAGQLNFLHMTAGILFPVALVLATWAVLGLLLKGRLRWVVVGLAVVFAVVDITENFLIDRILTQNPLNEGLVAVSSVLTVTSWVLLVGIVAVVIGVVVRDLVRGRR
ncbi:hypothetical protein [Nesterenkonia flava]|uniref:Uncharacterized protein n=1 Tax=Nesterenkonia flava TaxID=469799 RepID=A0ABU1FVP1_9MICC|nr:hypothetical protein [Nesterenkonia flava]MDR5712745.1 hypothetical protein [Nesterenkonia flava]